MITKSYTMITISFMMTIVTVMMITTSHKTTTGHHGDSQHPHHDNHTVVMKTTSNRMTARADMIKAGTHMMTNITLTMKT